MKEVIVIATKEELKLISDPMFLGVPIIITGVGGTNIIKALKDLPRDTKIINIGYAGSNVIDIGTRVDVSICTTYHPNVDFIEPVYNLDTIKSDNVAPCYTSGDFVLQTDIKEPCVFDMELAYICSMFDNVRSIKYVSDNLNLKNYYANIK